MFYKNFNWNLKKNKIIIETIFLKKIELFWNKIYFNKNKFKFFKNWSNKFKIKFEIKIKYIWKKNNNIINNNKTKIEIIEI